MSFLLRVLLPDRPGSLGAFTTALGAAGVDIVSLEIVERRAGVAVDDLVVELPPGAMADRVVSAAHSVPDVVVESLRPYHGSFDTSSELELVESLAASPHQAHQLLAASLPKVFRASWALVLGAPGDRLAVTGAAAEPAGGTNAAGTADGAGTTGSAPVLAAGGAAPEVTCLSLPFLPLAESVRLDEEAAWVPGPWKALGTVLAAAPLGPSRCTSLVGRTGGPAFLDSEVLRLGHLASIVGMVSGAEDASHHISG